MRYYQGMEKINEIIAENLIELRKEQGLTQYQFAEKLNYSNKTISKWELGYAIPNVETLKEIADYFGVSVDYFLNPHDTKTKTAHRKMTLGYRISTMLLVDVFFFLTAAIAFIATINIWSAFIFACAFSGTFNAIVSEKWWHNYWSYIFSSIGIWAFLVALYFTLLIANITYNFWYLFFLGLPIQVAVILIFKLKHIGHK